MALTAVLLLSHGRPASTDQSSRGGLNDCSTCSFWMHANHMQIIQLESLGIIGCSRKLPKLCEAQRNHRKPMNTYETVSNSSDRIAHMMLMFIKCGSIYNIEIYSNCVLLFLEHTASDIRLFKESRTNQCLHEPEHHWQTLRDVD